MLYEPKLDLLRNHILALNVKKAVLGNITVSLQ